MNSRIFLIIIFFVIGLTIGGPIFAILAVIFSLYLSGNPLKTFGKDVNEIEKKQAKIFAMIIGYLLRQTGNNRTTEINRAKAAFSEVSQQLFNNSYSEFGDEIYNCATQDFDINGNLAVLRNSFTYRATRLNPINLISTLCYVYCTAINAKGDNLFASRMIQIGLALGLPREIVLFALMNYCDTEYQKSGGGYDYSDFTNGQHGGSRYNYNSNSGGYYPPNQDQAKLNEAYTIMGVSSNVTKDELRKAKKRLLIQWHPDKAPTGQEEQFTLMSQKINAAYDLIASVKGFE